MLGGSLGVRGGSRNSSVTVGVGGESTILLMLLERRYQQFCWIVGVSRYQQFCWRGGINYVYPGKIYYMLEKFERT